MNRDAAEALLLARGCTVTAQRRAILAFLDGNQSHPTAADVFAAVTHDFPMASRATVYNTLSLLAQVGVVLVMRESGNEARFDPNVTHHHHIICPICGHLADVPASEVTITLRGLRAAGRVCFEARCGDCSSASE